MITGKALGKVIQFITKKSLKYSVHWVRSWGGGGGGGGGGVMYFQEPNCHCKGLQHLVCFVCIVV